MDLGKLLNGAENAIGTGIQDVGNFVGNIGHDIAGDFQGAVHAAGQALGITSSPAPTSTAPPPQSRPSTPAGLPPQFSPQFQSGQSGYTPGNPNSNNILNKLSIGTPSPTNPTGLNNQPNPTGGIKVGPSNQNVLAGLQAQQQKVMPIKINNTLQPAINTSNLRLNTPNNTPNPTPMSLPSRNIPGSGSQAPAPGDITGLTKALRGLTNYTQDDQARIVNRSAQAGLIPRNYAAALQNDILSPSLDSGQQTDRSNLGELAQAAEQNMFYGGGNVMASLAKQVGTNLANKNLYNQQFSGKLDPGLVQNITNEANANNGNLVTPQGLNYGRLATESGLGVAEGALPGLGELAGKAATFGTGYLFPDVAGGVVDQAGNLARLGLPTQVANPLIDNSIKLGTGVLAGAPANAAINAAGATTQGASPSDTFKASIQGLIQGGALGLGGEAASIALPKIANGATDIAGNFSDQINNLAQQHLTPLDQSGAIRVPGFLQRKYNGLLPDQVIMDTRKLDTLNAAREILTLGTDNVNALNKMNAGLHQIYHDNGLDFITGSNAERLQKITQYLEQNGEAIPKLQDNNPDPIFTPLNQGGYLKVPWLEDNEREIDPISQNYAQENNPEEIINDTADQMYNYEKSLKGGMLQSDGEGGYRRITEHGQFYRDYYAENGRAPSKAAYKEEVKQQLENGGGNLVDGGLADAYQLAKQRTAEPLPTQPLEDQQLLPKQKTADSLVNNNIKLAKQPSLYAETSAKPGQSAIERQAEIDAESDKYAKLRQEEAKPVKLTKSQERQVKVQNFQQKQPPSFLAADKPSNLESQEETKEPLLYSPKESQKLSETLANDIGQDKTKVNSLNTALDMLEHGKTPDEAMYQYMLNTGTNLQQAAKDISQAARKRGMNSGINIDRNPLRGTVSLPTAQEGDWKRVVLNKQGIEGTEMRSGAKALEMYDNLTPHDQALLADIEIKPVSKVAEGADRPQDFIQAANSLRNYFNLRDAYDAELGIPHAYRINYIRHIFDSVPDDTNLSDQLAAQPNTKPGYIKQRLTENKVGDVRAALERDITGSVSNHGALAALKSLNEAFPDKVSLGEVKRDENGANYEQLASLGNRAKDIFLQKDVAKIFNDRKTYEYRDDALGKIAKGYDTYNGMSKFFKLAVGGFHNMVEFGQFTSRALLHGDLAGIGKNFASWASKRFYNNEIKKLEADGTLSKANFSGLTFKVEDIGADTTTGLLKKIPVVKQFHDALFQRQIPYAKLRIFADETKNLDMNNPADALKMQRTATGLNYAFGGINRAVEGIAPHSAKIWSRLTLALDFNEGQARSIVNAITKGGPEGKIAREVVVGKMLMFAAPGTVQWYLANPKQHNPEHMAEELLNQFFEPHLNTNIRNSKGETQAINFPMNIGGKIYKVVNEAVNPQGGNSRSQGLQTELSGNLSSGLSQAYDIGRNQDYYGHPIIVRNPNGTINIGKSGANVASQFAPIAAGQIQSGATGQQPWGVSALNVLGFKVATNPDDPQYQANQKFWATSTTMTNALKTQNWNAISPELNNIMNRSGLTTAQKQQMVQDYLNNHQNNMLDINGAKLPAPWSASSAQDELNQFTFNNQKTGNRELGPGFFVSKKDATATPGYPVNPLYKLNGNGTLLDENMNPRNADKALVAMQYAADKETNPQAAYQILQANGGQNGWLASFLNAKFNYDVNYQKNMTAYMQKQGATPQYINQYWQNHPTSPPAFTPPIFNKATTNALNTYYSLLNDPSDPNGTAATQFFKNNASTLEPAIIATAEYTRHKLIASLGTTVQDMPQPSAHVQAILNSLPQGTDPATKKQIAQIISSDPETQQYLADNSLYQVSKTLGENSYLNPASPNMNEGDLLNAEGSQGQKVLKDTVDLGKYDIGNNLQAANAYNHTLPTAMANAKSNWVNLITQYANQYGIDPKAALAVASAEGLSGAVGDSGHAFGPFQMNDAVGVLAGRFPNSAAARAYAESPAGIEEAIRTMAQSGAKGLTGAQAIEAIVGTKQIGGNYSGYERPANEAGEIQRALQAYGGNANFAAKAGSNYQPMPTSYEFMGADGNTGGFDPGFLAAASSSGSKPFVQGPKYLHTRRLYAKRPPKIRKAGKVYVRGSFHPKHGSVSIKHGSSVAKSVKLAKI